MFKNSDNFNKENCTPNDIAELMADLLFICVANQQKAVNCSCYDGCCGTGELLTKARERFTTLAAKNCKNSSIRLFGQDCNEAACEACKSNLTSTENNAQADQIVCGSTLSADEYAERKFDFIISEPPLGKSWKNDKDNMGKMVVTDSRFTARLDDGEELSMLPKTGDSQFAFLLNNIAKMDSSSTFGTRIAEIHSETAFFKGGAGSGESNARRYLIENDLIEAIIKLPKNTLYSTGASTFIWLISNRKNDNRKGKIQLIDASGMKKKLPEAEGRKKYEITGELREEIIKIYLNMEENEKSRIVDNKALGFWEITVNRPLRQRVTVNVETIRETVSMFNTLYGVDTTEDDTPVVAPSDFFSFAMANPTVRTVKMPKTPAEIEMKTIYNTYMMTLMDFVRNEPYMDYNDFIDKFYNHPIIMNNPTRLKRFEDFMYPLLESDPKAEIVLLNGVPAIDADLRSLEYIPLSYEGGIEEFMKKEILPFSADAWFDQEQVKIGYEINFDMYFGKLIKA